MRNQRTTRRRTFSVSVARSACVIGRAGRKGQTPETDQGRQDHPQGFPRPCMILFRDVPLAVRTVRRVFENLFSAVRAGNGRLITCDVQFVAQGRQKPPPGLKRRGFRPAGLGGTGQGPRRFRHGRLRGPSGAWPSRGTGSLHWTGSSSSQRESPNQAGKRVSRPSWPRACPPCRPGVPEPKPHGSFPGPSARPSCRPGCRPRGVRRSRGSFSTCEAAGQSWEPPGRRILQQDGRFRLVGLAAGEIDCG